MNIARSRLAGHLATTALLGLLAACGLHGDKDPADDPPDPAVIQPAGGTVSGDNDKIRLQIAPGVLAGPTRFGFAPRADVEGLPAGYQVQPGTVYDITWEGAGFVGAREFAFGIRSASSASAVATAPGRAHAAAAAATASGSTAAVVACSGGPKIVDPRTLGNGYEGGIATLCDGDGRAPTRIGLVTPPPPPPPPPPGPWTQVGLPALQRALVSVAFAGPATVVALGTDARYIRSTDAGLTWTEVNSPLPANESGRVAFADDRVGLIVSARSNGGSIRRTTDGGVNWVNVFDSGAMNSVAFGSPTLGVAVGERGRILRTSDAGLTWTESNAAAGVVGFTGVAFADVNTVVAVGGTTVRRSIDGGQTFATVATPPLSAWRVAFGSAQAGVVVGLDSRIAFTTDGGQNWTAASGAALASVTQLHDVAFLDPANVIAVGQGFGHGVILRSSDAGRTWVSIDAGMTDASIPFALAFANARVGVVTGSGGSVLRTTTGGL